MFLDVTHQHSDKKYGFHSRVVAQKISSRGSRHAPRQNPKMAIVTNTPTHPWAELQPHQDHDHDILR